MTTGSLQKCTKYAVDPPPLVTVPVRGTDARFPVRRVYCVGRNYVEHAVEMGFKGEEPPFYFCKPTDAVVPVLAGQIGRVPYPPGTTDFQYEAELVVAVGRGGCAIAEEDAQRHVYGYALGLDMTRRDQQLSMRRQGRPWEVGKAFDCSAPIGPIHRVKDVGVIASGEFTLTVDGEVRQHSDFSRLIWNIPQLLSHLSHLFTLAPGDIVFTGTPAGVGPVCVGQEMKLSNATLGELRVTVSAT